MNSRQRRRLRRLSERMCKLCDLIGQRMAQDLGKWTATISRTAALGPYSAPKLDPMTKEVTEEQQYEVLTRKALEEQRHREEGAQDMAALIEAGIEKRLGELVYAGVFPVTIRDVKDAVRSLACAACRGSGLIRQGCKCSQVVSQLLPPDRYHPSECETGGVKYCACRFGAEQYQRDLTRTDVITAPITREWHLFPKSQYGTPEFLQLCMDQAAEARKVGRLACANALDRYVERELLK